MSFLGTDFIQLLFPISCATLDTKLLSQANLDIFKQTRGLR